MYISERKKERKKETNKQTNKQRNKETKKEKEYGFKFSMQTSANAEPLHSLCDLSGPYKYPHSHPGFMLSPSLDSVCARPRLFRELDAQRYLGRSRMVLFRITEDYAKTSCNQFRDNKKCPK